MGIVSGVQRYLCRSCRKSFRSLRKLSRLRAAIWHDFVFNRQTINQLAARHNSSIDWIRKELRAYNPPLMAVSPCAIVVVMDCVFFGRTRGYLVVRNPHRKLNVYWSEIERETLAEYQCARDTLEAMVRSVSEGRLGKVGVAEFFRKHVKGK